MIFKVLAKMKIFQIWAKIDDFFKFLAKMMIFQNLVKIDGFSNFNFLCHLKFSNSSQCGMLWCGVVQTTLLWCGVELIPHHTFRQSTHQMCNYSQFIIATYKSDGLSDIRRSQLFWCPVRTVLPDVVLPKISQKCQNPQ